MKLPGFTYVLAASAVVLSGCQYPNGEPNNTGGGALLGAGVGAASGAVIGGRNAGAGALIGGAIGAIAGGLIGNSMDQEQQERLRSEAPQTYARVDEGRPLSLADVKALAKAGISEDVIINQIKNSRTVFHLSAADIIDLRDSGVSDRIINFMINTPAYIGVSPEVSSASKTVIVSQPPPRPPVETVVVAPGPDYVWINGEWSWNSGWVWIGGHWCYPPYPRAVWVGGYYWHGARGWHNVPGHWR